MGPFVELGFDFNTPAKLPPLDLACIGSRSQWLPCVGHFCKDKVGFIARKGHVFSIRKVLANCDQWRQLTKVRSVVSAGICRGIRHDLNVAWPNSYSPVARIVPFRGSCPGHVAEIEPNYHLSGWALLDSCTGDGPVLALIAFGDPYSM